MVVQNRVIQKLSDIFHCRETPDTNNYSAERVLHPSTEQVPYPSQERELVPPYEEISRALVKAQGEWFSAIATLETLLLSSIDPSSIRNPTYEGLILSSPSPVLSHPRLLSCFYSGVFTPEVLKRRALMPSKHSSDGGCEAKPDYTPTKLPLFLQDPLAGEQFCLILTHHFGLLMVLGEDDRGLASFDFSFDPEAIQQGWMALRDRLLLTNHPQLTQLDILSEQFAPPTPDYKVVMEFSRHLLKNLPEPIPAEPRRVRSVENISHRNHNEQVSVISVPRNCNGDGEIRETIPHEQMKEKICSPDVELLQALTHEIRTPLTTIRTMTRLLLKRAKLTPEMTKCLEVIDQECTEQINRMELIFRAAEWGTTTDREKRVQLVPISLEQVFEQSIPRWKKQAQRRNVDLDVVLPKKLPQVVSDPAMLEQMLTGLMEKFTRSVPTGGNIQVQVTTAGNQLKLQFNSQSSYQHNPFKALGQLLMFQPDTGSLSLNLDITKNLFEALGGKLIVRQRPHEGEVLTVFLPLGGNRW